MEHLRPASAIRRVSVAAALIAVGVPASARATSTADREATHTYLQAIYTLELALVRNAAQEKAGATAFAAKLSAECPNVLRGSPKEEPFAGEPTDTHTAPPSARERGESKRLSRQRGTLGYELETAIETAAFTPDREAFATFSNTIAPLRWSNPDVAVLVSVRKEIFSSLGSQPMPDVCGDMRAWVSSDYRVLSPASRAFATELETRFQPSTVKGSLAELLKPYEGEAERTLIARTKALKPSVLKAVDGAEKAGDRAHAALGEELENPPKSEERGALIGKGVTHAGSRFTIRIERGSKAHALGYACKLNVSIEYTTVTQLEDGVVLTSSGSTRCVHVHSDVPLASPSLDCADRTLRIESQTLLGTRHVRLLLSNGHTVTSRVVRIPARLGGPASLYIQAVHAPSPYPVSLTEIGAHGETLRSIELAHLRSCGRRSSSPFPEPVTLVHGVAPDGSTYTINGTSFRFDKHREFNLHLSGAGLEAGGSGRLTTGQPLSRLLKPVLAESCAPHAFMVLYGLLKAPGESALAQTTTGLVPLQKVAIPANLDAGGMLVYGVFETAPTEVIVQGADGQTLDRESLATQAREESEFCEGSAEPVGAQPTG